MRALTSIVEKYSLYVDGSCLENQNVNSNTPAAWGLVVIVGDNGLGKGSGDVIDEKFGHVITDSKEGGYIGAEVGSNNTAELTAMAQALRWLLIDDTNKPAIINTDSQYAGNLACGNWKAKANKKLVRNVQKLWDEVGNIRELTWNHVRAHRGHRWNERADHLAIRCVSNLTPTPLSFWKPGQR